MSEPRQLEPGSYNRMHDEQMATQIRFREQENPDLFEPMPPPLRQLNREQVRYYFNYSQLTQLDGGRRKRITKRNKIKE
jgi:hypothetical protein